MVTILDSGYPARTLNSGAWVSCPAGERLCMWWQQFQEVDLYYHHWKMTIEVSLLHTLSYAWLPLASFNTKNFLWILWVPVANYQIWGWFQGLPDHTCRWCEGRGLRVASCRDYSLQCLSCFELSQKGSLRSPSIGKCFGYLHCFLVTERHWDNETVQRFLSCADGDRVGVSSSLVKNNGVWTPYVGWT